MIVDQQQKHQNDILAKIWAPIKYHKVYLQITNSDCRPPKRLHDYQQQQHPTTLRSCLAEARIISFSN